MLKALYYPFINIPQDSWLTQSLLYWDELSCIAPKAYHQDVNLYDIHMAEYINEGLVKPCSPEDFIYRIDTFVESFVEYIDSSVEIKRIQRDISLGISNKYTNIHFEKLGRLATELIDRKLAAKGSNGWLLVESRIALHFMTYLATLIGYLEDYQPITREDINFLNSNAKFLKANRKPKINIEGITIGYKPKGIVGINASNRLDSHRDIVLKELLPSPSNRVTAKELLKFKEKHTESLMSFRSYIENFCLEYDSIADDLKELKLRNFTYESNQQKVELEGKMKDFKWTNLDVFDFGLYGIDFSLAYFAYLSQDIKTSILGLSAIGIAVLKTMKDNRKEIKDLRKKPMSYVVNLAKLP